MSNYKTHTKFNLFLALPILTAIGYYTLHPSTILLSTFAGVFAYCTLFMSPDLDLAHQIKLKSLRGFFSLPFRFYSKIFKHRGLSHSALFGSLTRILWLAGIALLTFYLVYSVLPDERTFVRFYGHYKYLIWYGFAGICLADWCHLLLDYTKIR